MSLAYKDAAGVDLSDTCVENDHLHIVESAAKYTSIG